MQKIAILYDASQIVLSTFNLDEVFTRILSTVRDYFRMPSGAIFLLDRQTNELYVRSSFGREAEEHGLKLRVPVGTGVTGSAAKLKRPLYAPDVSKEPRYIEGFANTRSELAIPLLVRDEVVGVLDFQSDEVNGFDKETIDLLTLFSTQASIAIQNAELYTLEQRRAAQLEAINGVSMETRSLLELEELLPRVCTLILKYFPVDHVSVLLLEDRRLVLRSHGGKLTPLTPGGLQFSSNAGLCGRALREGKTLVANDLSKYPEYVNGFTHCAAEMALPLLSFGQSLGVLVLDNGASPFRPEDVQALESVADICAVAIQSAYSFERARQMSDIDGLTGVYNRRHLEKRLVAELERLARYEHQMAILMIDIDNFKRINDEFGHLLGDEVLRQASKLLQQNLRKADVVCRFGGEEFAIMLPETHGENALGVAEKLRREIADYNFPGIPRSVTISVGVAEFPHSVQTRDELIRAADEALYAAKQAGRNRVRSSGEARATTKSTASASD